MTKTKDGKLILASTQIKPIIPMFELHKWNPKTLQKKIDKNAKYTYDLVYDMDHLYTAFRNSKKQCDWKKSVQNFEKHSMLNIFGLYQVLKNMEYEQKPFYEFTIHERGKERLIKAMHIEDRIVQRSLSDYILNPSIEDYLIWDNGASVKGKGVTFCRKRMLRHLQLFYRQNRCNDGYILRIDFSKFFDNLMHEYALKILSDIISDDKVNWLLNHIMKSFEQDVSYMTDDEYVQAMFTVFNSIDYQFIPNELKTGEKMLAKSVGIGSHISQICGIFYPSEIDNYCKIVKGLQFYGRYMDDIYIIHKDRQYLVDLLNELEKISRDLGLTINRRKTSITHLSNPFKFLQIKYRLCEDGQVLEIPSSKIFTRERRRLTKFKTLLDNQRITYFEVGQCYNSWRGNLTKYDCYRSLQSTDEYFYQVFGYTHKQLMNKGIFHFRPDCIEGGDLDPREFYTVRRQIYESK